MSIVHQNTRLEDLKRIVTFPKNDHETFYLFTITESLTFDILKSFYEKRFGSTSFTLNGEIVGYANFYRYTTDSKEIIYLGNVILESNYRGYGYSKEMLHIMINKAKQEFGVKELRLAVFCNNTSACQLYKSMGFKVLRTEERTNQYNEKESIFIMAKQLGED